MGRVGASSRTPYEGTQTTILIAIDVGTTYSGVTYAIQRPKEIPLIQGVTRFPGQGYAGGDSKVPSVLYYDENGKVQAAGAETEDENVIEKAEEGKWFRVEHFKLALRPASMQLTTNGLKLGTLPPNKTAMEVFGDFLAYMLRCTAKYIQETHVDGPQLWDNVKGHAEFIITHPNGWEGSQQQTIRRAAIHGGLIPDNPEGHGRVKFVTEGEASLHGCLSSRLAPSELRLGDAFIVADAGGGTLDINAYQVTGTSPLRLEEIVASECRFAGSIFVNQHARDLLEEKLKGSKWGTPELIDNAAFKTFEKITKRVFSDRTQPSWVPVGGLFERDSARGIRGGKLKLTGDEVAKCFEFSVAQAVECITKQMQESQRANMDVWLVGGFAASSYLFDQLQVRLAQLGVSVYRPDANASKAVANGAISFYLDHYVTARVARFSTGVDYCEPYDPFSSEHGQHVRKGSTVVTFPGGRKMIGPKFQNFISKGMKITETATVSHNFFYEFTSLDEAKAEVVVLLYRGNGSPKWIDDDPKNFVPLCTVSADLRKLCGPPQNDSAFGKPFWRLEYDIEFKFGLTEYQARVKWIENGKAQYGPASLIYDAVGGAK